MNRTTRATICRVLPTALLSVCLVAALSAQTVVSPRLESFENGIPTAITASDGCALAVSSAHSKDGSCALHWSFPAGGRLSFDGDLRFEPRIKGERDGYLATFIIWIYNPAPRKSPLRFEFRRDGRPCTSFEMQADFKGWRAAWVCYERDMQGTPEEGMNSFTISSDEGGEIYIDHLITSVRCDPRNQTADLQVPFVNPRTDNHWLILLRESRIGPDTVFDAVTPRAKKQMELIESRFREIIYQPSKVSAAALDKIRSAYAAYGIAYGPDGVKGLPIFFTRAREAYERLDVEGWRDIFERSGQEVKQYFDLMNRIAVAYNNSSDNSGVRTELEGMFTSMYDHITDQGFVYGSCTGNFSHYGYSFRGLYTAYFLMKDVLRRHNVLDEASRTLCWYSMANQVFEKPKARGMDMDAFNTTMTGLAASILIMDDSPEKLAYLTDFARLIDNGCLPSDGLAGAFKIDGGAFHHRNNYPAYADGGLTGATNMIYMLHGTDFAVGAEGHETVRNVLLTMRFYCNTLYYPLSMSGRHPNGQGKINPMQYATMAMSGTPDRKSGTDTLMAAAFLRLAAADTPSPRLLDAVVRFERMGIKAEPDPQGNISLAYGCVSVQRRGVWSAVVRGHSRYLWASEHYVANNFYGRYLAHGSMQIMTAPKGVPVTPATSLWQQEGFDWGRIPATTAVHLPVEQLRARIYNVDRTSGYEEMLLSDEAFAGGLSAEGRDGLFAMKLHEHDKYNGTLRARKSFHFLGDFIVCVGTDIECANTDYPTETTVFQLCAATPAEHDYWNSYVPKGKWYVDSAGTGYYIPRTENLVFAKNFPQYSRDQADGSPTEGDWVSLVINHSVAPKGASYEYAVVPSAADMKAFASHKPYKVLRADRFAHVVTDRKGGMTSYAVFEPHTAFADGLVMRADTALLAFVRRTGRDRCVLTVANPDLALYRGASDERYDSDGKRIERSVYARSWIDSPSGVIPTRIVLRGRWKAVEDCAECSVTLQGDTTVLEFACRDGRSIDVRLEKI